MSRHRKKMIGIVRTRRLSSLRIVPLFLPAALILLLASATGAASQTIPAEMQLPIYFKLLTYDRTLWDVPEPRLRIGLLHRLGNDASRQNYVAMREALDASADKTVNGVPFEVVTISWKDVEDLGRRISKTAVDVLYVTAGHGNHLDSIARSTRHRGILTLAGSEGYVGRGLSVGLSPDGERIRIEVDLEALAAEGHQLDAHVLRLCKLVSR